MTETKKSTLFVIARIIHVIIAAVFLLAAFSKALDPPAFVEQIASYKIFPQLASFGAWFFIIVECLLAGMLIVNLYPRFTQLASMALLLLFSGVIFYAIVSGDLSNCGCFGNLVPRTPEQTLVEDLIMVTAMVFAIIVTWNRKAKITAPKYVVAVLFGLGGLFVGLFHQQLPADDFATQLKPGAHFTSWPTEGLYENLNEGTHVVFLFSLEVENLEENIGRMNEVAQSEDVPSAIGLITDGSEQLTTLMFQYGTGFPSGALEPRFARNLYRVLPRAFVIQDGYVKETWSKIPDKKEVETVLQTLSASE